MEPRFVKIEYPEVQRKWKLCQSLQEEERAVRMAGLSSQPPPAMLVQMKTIQLEEAHAHLPDLVDRVANGKEF